jgi:ABC transport system ATP-binding/permease protein
MKPIVEVVNLTKYWGEYRLFEDISFSLNQGEKTALIARNGTGKTSLLNIISGLDTPDEGSVKIHPQVNIGYLKQDNVYEPGQTVAGVLFSSDNPVAALVRNYEETLLSGNSAAIEKAVIEMDQAKAWDYEARVKQILSKLKITNIDQNTETLSGGQRKRLALASVLIAEPEFLILDEPTNHLDLDMIEWLEEYLRRTQITLFMVTHDRYFLDRVCNVITELENGTIYTYQGNYSYFIEKRAERIMVMKAEVEKARNQLRTEQDWMNRMPKARSHKAKYRVDNYYELKDKASQKFDEEEVDIRVKSARLGKKIIEFINVNKSFDKIRILDNFNYRFSRFEKIGIVGANGTGKSTFLNILTGSLQPDSGIIEVGETIKLGYFRQDGLNFAPEKTVIEVITEISENIQLGNGQSVSPMQYLNHFLFPPTMHRVQIGKLSGGERRRLYLMTILMSNPNFLILDEPTNDLDISTLNVLEDYLSDFEGCLILVSHDRYFMDQLVDHLFVFEGNGVVRDFPGNYSDYRDRLDEDARKIRKTEQTVKNPESTKTDQPVKTKLSWKEKKELEQLELKLQQLEAEKGTIEQFLSSGHTDTNKIIEKAERMKALLSELEEAEMRWLELSDKEA